MFSALPPDKDLHDNHKNGLTGGPSIIFHRHYEAGITKIRQSELGKAARSGEDIVGYDANASYMWSTMQDMPTEAYVRRSHDNNFRPKQIHC